MTLSLFPYNLCSSHTCSHEDLKQLKPHIHFGGLIDSYWDKLIILWSIWEEETDLHLSACSMEELEEVVYSANIGATLHADNRATETRILMQQ